MEGQDDAASNGRAGRRDRLWKGRATRQTIEGQGDVAINADSGASVRDLQDAVRDAVERGDFHAQEGQPPPTAKSRLESLLADLTNLKLRLDAVRAAA